MKQIERTLTSLEVAEMVDRRHDQVLRDINTIIGHFGDDHKSVGNYFIAGGYTDSRNRKKPCFKLTKKGCELYGTRMTGEKGTQFAVAYIERFNEMEQHLQKPMSQLEIMQMQINQLVQQDRRITVVEEKQDNIVSILSLDINDWRNKINRIINAIVMKLGGGEYYREIRNQSYQLLESRAACNLDIRLNNRKQKMALRGSSKSAINRLTKLDVIAEDKKLISVYITVIKEMAVKYQLDHTRYNLGGRANV